MKKLKRFKLYLFCLVPVLFVLCAPVAGKNYSLKGIGTVEGDSSRIVVRAPSAAKMKEFRENSDFFYGRDRPPVTFLQKVKYWLLQRIMDVFYFGAEYHIWKIMVYGLVAAAFIFIIVKLFNTDLQGLFYRKRIPTLGAATSLLPEEEHRDYDSLIDQYISEKKFRHAVRVMYVKLLHDLGDRGLITLKIDKTNREYLHELKNPGLKKNFTEATRCFDYVWYGNFDIDESAFSSMRSVFLKMSRNREGIER